MRSKTIGNFPAVLNLRISQATTFRRTLKCSSGGTPLDLTDWEFFAYIKRNPLDADEDRVAEFICTITSPELGEVDLLLSSVASDLPCGESEDDDESIYYWDGKFVKDNDEVSRPVGGTLAIKPKITGVT